MPIDPEKLHDKDWSETKATDAFYSESPRYYDLSKIIEEQGPKIILDVGCGSGFLSRTIKARLPDLIVDGADISSIALERAKNLLRNSWQVNLDRADLPASSCAYDTAVCVEVLEHLYDPEHVLKEIHRCLKPGGRLIATVPNAVFWRYRIQSLFGQIPAPISDPRHLHAFNAHMFKRLLHTNGFHMIKLTGHSVRGKILANLLPQLCSDILIATVEK
jgi:O-antigen biosynthesis protein